MGKIKKPAPKPKPKPEKPDDQPVRIPATPGGPRKP